MIGKNAAIIGVVASILLASASASAQDAAAPPPAAAALKTAPPPGGGDTDHDGVVNHIGVTVFTTQEGIPVGAPNAMGVTATATAPVIGVRYWIMPNLGIDAGLGIGWITGTAPSPLAMAFHAGVPLALSSSKHFTFIVCPEANLGFAHEKVPAAGMPDTTLDGFLFDIGARAGAEIQFGFIGVPQLSLEASVGLLLAHTNGSTNVAGAPANSGNTTSLTTTLGTGNPWAIFANTIQATYYL